ncbi:MULTISPECIES: RNA-binding protein [Natronorubrum]|uniref:RNA-binding protein n=2 Tax=Natronorubrum bangense TaxID=61858 RepID=L9WSJ4_9EURY|nr:RNA-binding protein [Natronorubrum bangense]ELY51288.1 RNA-binding protein [Natronorubrum bangense JCM 10635]QCC54728.1 RNA-binding protein [Natronorubrum bangense]
MQVKSRHHLRSDAVSDVETTLEEQLGVSPDGDAYERVEFENTDWEVILIDGEPQVAYFDDEPFLTVRGANVYEPEKQLVTVDSGAISFVSDGADVMRPGITAATDDISPDDLVVIAEETHGKVLAVGRARVEGSDMVGDEGKVVESLHHVGDDLYEFAG